MAAKKPAGAKPLPPITVGKMREAAELVERLVIENTSLFSTRIREHREARAEGSERQLTQQEAAQLAASVVGALAEAGNTDAVNNPEKLAAKFQKSDLRAVDAVPQSEVLLAAGLATAPAILVAVAQLVALIEMDADTYREARESGKLDDAIKQAATALDDLPLEEGRDRAGAALDHFQTAAGAQAGEALGLIRDMMGQAIAQATAIDLSEQPSSPSLTGSPPPTDGSGE